MDREIHTLNDWMKYLADALDDMSPEMIEQLRSISNNWLQADDEREAQLKLLDAAERIIYDAYG